MSWEDAATLHEFGRYTAKYLNGQISMAPTSVAMPVLDETIHLLRWLTPLNSSGTFVTIASQPGCDGDNRPMGGTSQRQKAFIKGWVPADQIERVERHFCAYPHLRVLTFGPGNTTRHVETLLSQNQGRRTPVGHIMDTSEDGFDLEAWYGDLNPELLAEMRSSAWQVVVHDSEWGCNQCLWPAIEGLVMS